MGYVLVLFDIDGRPFRTIGPFDDSKYCLEWMTDNIGSRPIDHVILELEPS